MGVNTAKANPTVAATAASSVATGGLAAGTYFVGYTWVDAFGETMLGASEIASAFTATGTTQLWTVTIPSKPTGVQSANIYLTKANGLTGTETLFATGITGTTFALSDALAVDMPGAAAPAQNSTGAAFHTTLIYALFGYGNERNIQGSRLIQDLSNYLSGYPIERRQIAMFHLRWAGIFKLYSTVLAEIGALVAANMPTATSSTVDGRGMPKLRWTLPA